VRRVHVFATAGAVLLLSSCSGQPNDLRDQRYYGQESTQSASSPSGTPGSVAPAVPTVPAPATKSASPKPPALDQVALSGKDLADESVQQTGAASRTVPAKLPDCDVPLGDAAAGYGTTWSYPSGATLRQYVAAYDADAGDIVDAVQAKLTCAKVSPPVKAADGQLSWCATTGKQSACTVMRADGSLLSVLVVTASTEAKAKQAVTRIAPRAATALARNS
jgi:hypothetical protein